MIRVRIRVFLLLLATSLAVTGCSPEALQLPRIRVAAASDLQMALPVLAIAFRQEHDIEIIPIYGASGQLAEQIRQGAPFDVFLSANKTFVDRLASEGLVQPKSIEPYARGTLVLAVNKLSAIKLGGMDDLKKPEVRRIAIANPELAPYGMAARQALERVKLWDELKPKLVQTESVRHALQLVQTGNAEVAFVGRSIADVAEAVVVPLPPDAYDPIDQYLGVTTKGANTDDGRAFADFVLSEVGQGILFQMGFRGVKSAKEGEPKPGAASKVATGP